MSHKFYKKALDSEKYSDLTSMETKKLENKMKALTNKVVLGIETSQDNIVQSLVCTFLVEENLNTLRFMGSEHVTVWEKKQINTVFL